MIPFLNYFTPVIGNGWMFLAVLVFLILFFLYFKKIISAAPWKWYFAALLIFLLARAALRVLFQYLIWNSGPPSIYFLPPHQPISYFLKYIFIHHAASLLLTLGIVFIISFVFFFFAKSRETADRRLWKVGEEYIFLSGALILRWPLVVPYLFLGILAAIVYFAFRRYILEEKVLTLQVSPFFAALVPLLLFLQETVLIAFNLKPLIMPL